MGDLAADTAVHPNGDGRFTACLQPDWEIWGPMGGYVAACALRAVGASSEHPRPATFTCHYLGVAEFAPVEIRVERRKRGRTASSYRVELGQGGRPILEGMVWTVADEVDGLEHDETMAPSVPPPDEVPGINDLIPRERRPPYPFWDNLDSKPLDLELDWPPDGPRRAQWQAWLRFVPTSSFSDPWVDAARSVILIDLPSWPSAHRPHAWRNPAFVAPTLDLTVAFHAPTHGARVAAVRRAGPAVDRRALRLDCPGLVGRRPTPCLRGRPMPLSPVGRVTGAGPMVPTRDASAHRAPPAIPA